MNIPKGFKHYNSKVEVIMHSTGPWYIECESNYEGESFIISAASPAIGRHVAYVSDVWIDDEAVITQECVDNARLIAAAPELLAALESMVNALLVGVPSAVGLRITDSPLYLALKAIDKARNGPLCDMYRDIVGRHRCNTRD